MSKGQLILVATPIGNLGDISERAIDVLRNADVIACEDTRHTRKLLTHCGINTPTIAAHEHNETAIAIKLIERIERGESVALVTDAGMPAISDPGARIVDSVIARGLSVSVVPGPAAFVCALVVSGFDTSRFVFEGFLPAKSSERIRRLQNLAQAQATTVLYEAPHRMEKLADELISHCGEQRRVCLVRELTKMHEELWRGTCSELKARVDAGIKGECVVVIEGAQHPDVEDDQLIAVIDELMSQGLSPRGAAVEVAERFKVSKNRTYGLAVALNGKGSKSD